MDYRTNSQISITENTQFTQQINGLLKKDPFVERRLLFLSQKQYTENLDHILNKKELDEFYSIYLEYVFIKYLFQTFF